MLRRLIEPGQYTAVRFSERLAEAGISASVGSVGDSFDNALAETINGLYKTELIKPRGPWRTVEEVEYATAEWVDWFNHRRLYEYCGDIPPAPPSGRELKNNVTGHAGAIQPRCNRNDRERLC